MRQGQTARQALQDVCEPPLFDGVHQALTFAFRYSGQQYSPSLIAQMMKGPMKSGKGLSGLDGAAQAGLIRAMIDRLPEAERNVIVARFSGTHGEVVQAMKDLIHPAMVYLGTGAHSTRMVSALVQRYFGADLHLADFAVSYGVSPPTMTRKWQSVRNGLKQLWERAEEGAFRELQAAGLIP